MPSGDTDAVTFPTGNMPAGRNSTHARTVVRKSTMIKQRKKSLSLNCSNDSYFVTYFFPPTKLGLSMKIEIIYYANKNTFSFSK